ncbi:NAD(P)/FAD-dependent oxidoreductase [Candidatus Micrarchaeota archaeon]|nr:NAD(P)/FAD-dependent oxidoreductase [Candidatus Micrarchaeota archaeon]
MLIYDTLIIGSGPTALTAAVFTARANLKVLVIGEPKKSMLVSAADLGNYIGTDGMSGPEWLDKGIEQIKKYGSEFLEQEVVHVEKRENFKIKTADNKTYESKTIIICTGVALRPAGIAGEKELLGKGVHTCVACDGWPYKQKKVGVIGNTNHAAEEVIELLALTKDVTLISNGKEFSISKELMDELNKAKIKFLKDKVSEFKGEKKLEKVILADNQELVFDGVFLALGATTALAFAQKLALDTKNNYLVVDSEGKTSLDGCYAAGACTGGNLQIAKSAGEGCNAAISVIKKVKGLANYSDLT